MFRCCSQNIIGASFRFFEGRDLRYRDEDRTEDEDNALVFSGPPRGREEWCVHVLLPLSYQRRTHICRLFGTQKMSASSSSTLPSSTAAPPSLPPHLQAKLLRSCRRTSFVAFDPSISKIRLGKPAPLSFILPQVLVLASPSTLTSRDSSSLPSVLFHHNSNATLGVKITVGTPI